MTQYQVVWDDSQTARVRSAGAATLRPLAWLRVSYREPGHEVGRVEVYSHAQSVPGRLWRGSTATIEEAVRLCHAQREDLTVLAAGETLPVALARPPVHPWAHATLVDVS